MIRYLSNQKVEIDIHGMTHDQAKRYLLQFLNRVNGSVREVQVIHGWAGGTVLRDMVRKGLAHPKLQAKVASANPGVTILILR